jgi:hypothetical protein
MVERAHAFLAAMSLGEGARVEQLVDPEVEVVIGPHVLRGVATVRRMAEEEAPLVMEVEPRSTRVEGDVVHVEAVRRQRWRETGEIANEDEVGVTIRFGHSGAVDRVELGV